MAEAHQRARSRWEDRFRTPSYEELLAESPKAAAALLDAARARLDALPESVSAVEWHGVPWRWSLTYRAAADRTRPWVFLVPQPGKPTIALPIATELIARLPMKRLPRFVRDGLVHAVEVAGARWSSWEFQSRAQLDDLLVLVELKHGLISGAFEAVSA